MIEVEIDAHGGEDREEGDVGFMFGAMCGRLLVSAGISVGLDEGFAFFPVWWEEGANTKRVHGITSFRNRE